MAFREIYIQKCQERNIDPLYTILHVLDSGSAGGSILDLSGRSIEPLSCQALAEALRCDTSFNAVSLRDCFIGDEGVYAIAAALRQHPTIVSLDLKGNNIGPDGAAALGEMLKSNTTLRTIILEWNPTRNSLLLDALAHNQTLESLDLRSNSLAEDAFVAAAQALRTNRALHKLDLRWNNARIAGGQAMVQALQDNKTLLELPMHGNQITPHDEQAIEALLQRNRTALTTTEQRQSEYDQMREQHMRFQGEQAEAVASIRKQYEEEITAQQSQFSQALQRAIELEHQLKTTQDTRDTLSGQVRQLSDAHAETTQKLRDLQQEAHQLKLDSDRAQAVLKQKLADAQKRTEDLEAELRSGEERTGRDHRLHKEELDRLRERNTELTELTQDLERQRQSLSTQLETSSQRSRTLDDQLKTEGETHRGLLKAKDDALEAVRQQTDRHMEEQRLRHEQQLHALTQRIAAIEERNLATLQDAKDREALFEQQMETERKRAQDESDNLKREEHARITLLADRLEKIQQNRVELQRKSEDLERQMVALRREHAQTLQQRDATNEQLQLQLKDAQDTSHKKDAELRDEADHVREVEGKNAQLMERIQELQREKSDLRQQSEDERTRAERVRLEERRKTQEFQLENAALKDEVKRLEQLLMQRKLAEDVRWRQLQQHLTQVVSSFVEQSQSQSQETPS